MNAASERGSLDVKFACTRAAAPYASGEDHRPAGLGARSGWRYCVLRLPMPREKLTNPPDWMIWESRQPGIAGTPLLWDGGL
jgi:hypothetical protein